MSAFWNQKEEGKNNAEEKKTAKKALIKKVGKKDVKSKKQLKLTAVQAELVSRTLKRPRVSEDTMNKQAEGKYVFEVALKATKNEVAKAIKALYGVDVEKVNVMNYKKKGTKFRGHIGQTKAFKKAIISIKEGQNIELFKEAK